MKYMIAIFDLDGTILNTLEDLADSTNYALKTCGYPERTMDEVRQFVGNGIRKLMERAVPEGTPVEEIDRVHETFTAHYKVHCADKTRPYDGIMELLQNLKKDGCKLAVVELPDAGLASALPNMPVCAVTAIGPDGVSRSVERLAALAAGVMRKDAVCVTAPEQPKAVLSELVVAAAKAECELVVPDAEDITFLEAEKFTSKVDYGGYTAPLAFLGRHAAGNAAVAVELALALWRKGFEIPDEAILAGLAAVENRSSIRVLSQKPLIILDACRTPQQAAALLRVLNMAKVRHMSAVIGLTEEEGAESFLAALETGLTSEEQKKDKSTMPGMGENPFDKVFLVAPAGTEAALAERLTEKARYHFDAVFCPTLAEAVEQAKANSRRGLLVCGSEAIALEALKLFS